MSPADATFSLLSCPHPPTRARRALFPAGRGDLRLFYARGFAPCIPGAGRDAALVRRALAAPGGGLPGWSSDNLAILMPSGCLPGWSPDNLAVPAPGGGLAVFVACLPCLLLTFLPPSPPPPSPAGKGEIFIILLQGASPLASPGLVGRGTGSAGVGGARRGLTVFVACLPYL